MRAFIEEIVDRIVTQRKKLLREMASEAYAQKLRAHKA